jgi:hypothetical protein
MTPVTEFLKWPIVVEEVMANSCMHQSLIRPYLGARMLGYQQRRVLLFMSTAPSFQIMYRLLLLSKAIQIYAFLLANSSFQVKSYRNLGAF